MFTKWGGAKTPDGRPKPDPSPKDTTTSPPTEANAQIPDNSGQIPMQDQSLPPPPGAPQNSGSEDDLLTLQQVLGNPSWAEDQLHGSLTLRALRWLALLEQDQGATPQPGKLPVSLDTQVEMFKVISDWLKTSKKTKGEGLEESGAPGIEQMREVIHQELEALKAEAPAEAETVEEEVSEEPPPPEPDGYILDGEYHPYEDGPRRRGRPKGSKRARAPGVIPTGGPRNNANMSSDSRELDLMISRARKVAYEED